MSAPIQSSGQPTAVDKLLIPSATAEKIYINFGHKNISYCVFFPDLRIMAYFKPSYGVNGLGIPMGPMDAATLHHSMGYSGTLTL